MAYKPKRYKKFVAAATTATLIERVVKAAEEKKMYEVIAFKSKNPTEDEKERYLSDGTEFADWSNEYGDVDNFQSALLFFMPDGSLPSQASVDAFTTFMEVRNTFDPNFFTNNYEPVKVEITGEQMKANVKRNFY